MGPRQNVSDAASESLLEKDSFEVVTFSAWKYRTALRFGLICMRLFMKEHERRLGVSCFALEFFAAAFGPQPWTFLVLAVTLSQFHRKPPSVPQRCRLWFSWIALLDWYG